jgi:hypothetical protein
MSRNSELCRARGELTLALLGRFPGFFAVLTTDGKGRALSRFSAISSPQSKQLP